MNPCGCFDSHTDDLLDLCLYSIQFMICEIFVFSLVLLLLLLLLLWLWPGSGCLCSTHVAGAPEKTFGYSRNKQARDGGSVATTTKQRATAETRHIQSGGAWGHDRNCIFWIWIWIHFKNSLTNNNNGKKTSYYLYASVCCKSSVNSLKSPRVD